MAGLKPSQDESTEEGSYLLDLRHGTKRLTLEQDKLTEQPE